MPIGEQGFPEADKGFSEAEKSTYKRAYRRVTFDRISNVRRTAVCDIEKKKKKINVRIEKSVATLLLYYCTPEEKDANDKRHSYTRVFRIRIYKYIKA